MILHRLLRGAAGVMFAVVASVLGIAGFVQPVFAQASDSGTTRGRMNRGNYDRPKIDEFKAFYEKSLKERVGLSDEQVVKWRAWNVHFDPRRRALWSEEGELRRTLRQQLGRGVTPDEAKVADAMDRFRKLDRNRLALKEEENRELEKFLKPIQSARFFVFQDQVQREMQEMQGRRDGGRGGRGGPPSGADSGRGRGMRGDTAGSGKGQRGGPPVRPTDEAHPMDLVPFSTNR